MFAKRPTYRSTFFRPTKLTTEDEIPPSPPFPFKHYIHIAIFSPSILSLVKIRSAQIGSMKIQNATAIFSNIFHYIFKNYQRLTSNNTSLHLLHLFQSILHAHISFIFLVRRVGGVETRPPSTSFFGGEVGGVEMRGGGSNPPPPIPPANPTLQ